MPKLKHAHSGRTITVTSDRVAFYTPHGWKKVAEPAPAPAFPEGVPTTEWKVDELKAYAAEHGIDLDASKKADILAEITAAKPVEEEPVS